MFVFLCMNLHVIQLAQLPMRLWFSMFDTCGCSIDYAEKIKPNLGLSKTHSTNTLLSLYNEVVRQHSSCILHIKSIHKPALLQ